MQEEDGVMMMSFTRDVTAMNVDDFSLVVRCMFIVTAWGGPVTSYGTPAQFGKHTQKGVIENLMCLQSCPGINQYPVVPLTVTVHN